MPATPAITGFCALHGGVAVLYGVGGVGLQAEAPDDQLWDQTLLNVSQESAAGDQFGWWVT